MKKQRDEITIKELIDIFIPKIWIVALVAVVFAGLLGGYSMFIKDDTFTSKASFVMVKIPTQYNDSTGTTAVTTGLTASEIQAMQSMIAMSEQVVQTHEYLSSVKAQLVARDARYESVSVSQLRSMLSIKIVGEATCFDLSVVSEDSQLSYDVSDIVYQTFPDVIEDVFDSYSVTIKMIDPPRKASSANAKGTFKNAVIGGASGVILSALVIFIISKLDVVVRSKEKIENSFDIPVIGLIPRFEEDN